MSDLPINLEIQKPPQPPSKPISIYDSSSTPDDVTSAEENNTSESDEEKHKSWPDGQYRPEHRGFRCGTGLMEEAQRKRQLRRTKKKKFSYRFKSYSKKYKGSYVTASHRLLAKDKSENITDFKIICRNGEEFKCFKFVLASRSDYFQAMFNFDPQKDTLELSNFDGPLMDIILNSFISIDPRIYDLNSNRLIEVAKISDYFQMMELTEVVINVISYR